MNYLKEVSINCQLKDWTMITDFSVFFLPLTSPPPQVPCTPCTPTDLLKTVDFVLPALLRYFTGFVLLLWDVNLHSGCACGALALTLLRVRPDLAWCSASPVSTPHPPRKPRLHGKSALNTTFPSLGPQPCRLHLPLYLWKMTLQFQQFFLEAGFGHLD